MDLEAKGVLSGNASQSESQPGNQLYASLLTWHPHHFEALLSRRSCTLEKKHI
jgi:hypothetical protein